MLNVQANEGMQIEGAGIEAQTCHDNRSLAKRFFQQPAHLLLSPAHVTKPSLVSTAKSRYAFLHQCPLLAEVDRQASSL